MALATTSLGATAAAANGTSRSLTLAASVAVGDKIVVAVAIDNTGTNGAAPASLTCTDSKGNAYGAPAATSLVDPGAASAGSYLAVWEVTSWQAMTTSDTITITTGASGAIAIAALKITAAAGKLARRGAVVTSTTTAGTGPSVTTGSVAAGELVVGAVATETTNAPTADSDTTNGSWSTQISGAGGNSGTATSNQRVSMQSKVVTGAGAQTYNVTTVSADSAIAAVRFTEVDPLIPGVPIEWVAGYFGSDPENTPPSDGASASAWRNGGVRGNAFSAGTNPPIYRSAISVLNNTAGLEFDGVNDFMSAGGVSQSQVWTLIFLGYLDVAGNPPGANYDFVSSPSSGISMSQTGTGLRVWASTSVEPSTADIRGKALYAHFVGNGGSSKWKANDEEGTVASSPGTGDVASLNMGGYADGTSSTQMYARALLLAPWDITQHPSYSTLLTWAQSDSGAAISSGTAYTATIADGLGASDGIAEATASTRTATDALGGTDTAAQAAQTAQTTTDTLGASDTTTAGLVLTQTVTDALGGADSTDQSTTASRSQTDAIGATDTATQVLAAAHALTDPIGGVDSPGTSTAATRAATDPLGVSDSAAPVAALTQAVTDPLGTTDATAPAAGIAQTVADSLGLADATAQASTVAQTATDGVGLADPAAQTATAVRGVTDLLGATDFAAAVLNMTASLTDPITAVDSTSQTTATARAATDGLGLADQASQGGAGDRMITDPAGVADQLSQAAGWGTTIGDPMGLTDTATRAATTVLTLLDPLGLVDTTSTDATGAITATITDGLGTTDTATTAATFSQVLLEQLGAADTTAQHTTAVRASTDQLGATDQAAKVHAAAHTILDQLGALDNNTSVSTVVRPLTDQLSALDTATQESTSAYSYVLADTLAGSDNQVRAVVAARTFTDPLTAVDATTVVAAFAQELADQLALADLLEEVAGREVVIIAIQPIEVGWHVTAIEARFGVGPAGHALVAFGSRAAFDVTAGSTHLVTTEGARTP